MSSPRWGPSPRVWCPACCLPCARPVVLWCVAVFVLCPLCHWLPASALRSCRDCPWRLTTLVPQGLSFSVSLPVAPAVSVALGSQRIFCPLSLVACAPACLMSRGDELRQLAAQLSVLAALEDSIALGLSRVMGPASPGRAAAPPDAGSPQLPLSMQRPQRLRWCLRPVTRWQPLCCVSQGCFPSDPHSLPFSCAAAQTCTASQFQRRLWPAWIGCWLRAWPPRVAHRSPPPQLRLSRVSRALHAASVGSQPSVDASGPSAPSAPASEAPRVTESASNSDDEWDALLDAHGPRPISWWRRGRRRPAGRRRWC